MIYSLDDLEHMVVPKTEQVERIKQSHYNLFQKLKDEEARANNAKGKINALRMSLEELEEKVKDCGEAAGIMESRYEHLKNAIETFEKDVSASLVGYKLADIMSAVSIVTDVSRVDIMSPRKPKQIAAARHIFFWFSRHLTARSFPEIGMNCGGRDHSTVIHGVNKLREKIKAGDGVTIAQVRAISNLLGATFIEDLQCVKL